MKKSLLFISMLVAGASNGFSQDTIPNAGFENWSGATPNEPLGWGTANGLFAGFATQATGAGDFHSGTSSIKLLTQNAFGTKPGVAASGATIFQAAPNVRGGIPYGLRPTSFTGWAKYVPAGTDTAIIGVIFTKWNSTATPPRRDTIGGASDTISTGFSSFRKFNAPITYATSAFPDTAQIILASSDATGSVGSALYIDDLDFILPPTLSCTPDPNIPQSGSVASILPDTNNIIVKTPSAAFNQTFTVYVPINLAFTEQGVPFTITADMDSIHIDDVSGMPSTFTLTCGTPDCIILAGQVGCFTVVGTMPMTDNVYYEFGVVMTPYGTITGPSTILGALPSTKLEDNASGETLATYTVQVGNPPVVGIEDITGNGGFTCGLNNPNPFDASTTINFTCPVSGDVTFTVVDVLGRQVYDTNINATAGSNTFTYTTDLSNGTYFFSLSDGTNTITRKMVISE